MRGTPPIGGVGEALAELRALLLPGKVPLKDYDTEKVRTRVIEILVEQIEKINKAIEKAGRKAEKGAGGASEFKRLCRLQAYLIQVLDGVIKNLSQEEIRKKLEALEALAEEGGPEGKIYG